MDNSTTTTETAAPTLPTSFSDVFALLMTFHALRDWLKLIVLGGALETCRRLVFGTWAAFISSFFLTAHFEENDTSYEWMMVWLAQHPAWQKAREVQISTRDYRNYDSSPAMLEGEEHTDSHFQPTRKLAYLPSFGTTNLMYFRGRRMTVTRNRQYLDEGSTHESLTVKILTRSRVVLNELLLEAKRAYTDDSKHRVSVFVPDSYNNWRTVQSRPKRPMSSIILRPEVKNMVLEDAREFLASEKWYAERGIPFRRGYLLHGAPGAGKTSLINSIAGELGLDIYVITLSKRGLDDTSLNALITDMPARSIALMEDIDAAFTHDVQRSAASSDNSDLNGGGGVTLSGLLGAIDGVAAQEGRLLFATTNHVERLDAALSRPGRMDIHIDFGLATKWQAGELFKAFYPPAAREDAKREAADDSDASETDTLLESAPATPSKQPTTLAKKDEITNLSYALRPPRLAPHVLNDLAAKFAEAVPDQEFSMAALQGHLMGFKTRPYEAVDAVAAFVERERTAAKRKAQLAQEKKDAAAAAVAPAS
ncbi:P-loop containing nucleoside triphosphate hydrolase protein [Exidia glandulosa HHB12029]|uniref:p-loop containing nucleoside triphosphate hydrolase protein n=1 Tax=Exidia glandulosa HHB12029 TaxID=1314781 RepID=A0A165KRY3_EXIGL|nr:P-loop containing nucleoside triphosphate hydrolase protein [Exidia glandulosa HHB12029]